MVGAMAGELWLLRVAARVKPGRASAGREPQATNEVVLPAFAFIFSTSTFFAPSSRNIDRFESGTTIEVSVSARRWGLIRPPDDGAARHFDGAWRFHRRAPRFPSRGRSPRKQPSTRLRGCAGAAEERLSELCCSARAPRKRPAPARWRRLLYRASRAAPDLMNNTNSVLVCAPHSTLTGFTRRRRAV